MLFTALLAVASTAEAYSPESGFERCGKIEERGAVFTMTDDPIANAVLAFSRSPDGALQPLGAFPTGGAGSGGGEGVLGSQGSVTLSRDGRFLLVVNAGSDEVSSFRVRRTHLELAGRAPSGGQLPVSVTEHDGLVYVLNARGAGNISGLRLEDDGALVPLPNSTRPLSSANSGGAQVAFDPSGELLVVTEKLAQVVSFYAVNHRGLASGPHPVAAPGMVPFGFAFTRGDKLVVTEAKGGPSGTTGAVSSYEVEPANAEVVSASVPNFQRAPCWVVILPNGRVAFTANAGSGTLSSYAIDRKGRLTLIAGSAAILPPNASPIDLDLANDGQLLYVLDKTNHAIFAFKVTRHGELQPLGAQSMGLPASTVGLAAR